MNNVTTPITFEAQNDSLIVKIERAEFTDFIKSLLGKPQTIENNYNGPFDINKNNIFSIYHLVEQRVTQQNKGDLIQFTTNIMYDDSSSVSIHGIDEFMTYSEIRQIIPKKVILTWIYLIKFEDRNAPEKQVIEFAITADANKSRNSRIDELLRFFSANAFTLKIEHTARTWGADMENLITNFIGNWQIKESPIKKAIYQNTEIVGLISTLLMFIAFCMGVISGLSTLSDRATQQATKAIAETSIDQKISSIISYVNSYTAAQQTFTTLIITLVGLIVAIFFGILMNTLANNRPKSFICFTEEATRHKEKSISDTQKGWGYFIATAITGTISGVLSKYIYTWLF